jgi:hypothetical protein
LGIIENVLTLQVSTDCAEQAPKKSSIASLLCVEGLLDLRLIFLFIWFIIGCIWIYRSWNKVQYIDPNQNNYCHPVLYRFTFSFLLLALLLQILSCCQSCWKIPLEIKKLKNAKSSSTTTAES